jgi:hypothetical protein
LSETPAAAPPLFRLRTALALVIVGVFAFAAFVTLLAYAPDTNRISLCRPNAYSPCAVGFQALTELVKESGAPMTVSRTDLPKGHTDGVLIVTPEAGSQPDVSALGFAGPTLVVLPKWMARPQFGHPTWGLNDGVLPTFEMPKGPLLDPVAVARRQGASQPILAGVASTVLDGVTLRPGKIDQLQTFEAKGWTPVLTDEHGAMVIAQAPNSLIYVLSEPDLLDTQGLGDPHTFAAAVTLLRALRAGDGPFIFDVTLNGYKLERNVLRLMFDPPFLAVTLCFAAAILLAGLQALFRFGPLRRRERAIALGKEALTDNSAQLIRLAGREAKMAPAYIGYTRKAAARAVGAPRELTGDQLTAFLDRLAAQRGLTDTLAGFEAEAGRVQRRTGLTALSQRLYRWRLEMTRERQ